MKLNSRTSKTDSTPGLLTKQQAADYIQTTPRYVERQVKAGRLRALKPTGKLVRIRLKDLEAFLKAAQRQTEVVNERAAKIHQTPTTLPAGWFRHQNARCD